MSTDFPSQSLEDRNVLSFPRRRFSDRFEEDDSVEEIDVEEAVEVIDVEEDDSGEVIEVGEAAAVDIPSAPADSGRGWCSV